MKRQKGQIQPRLEGNAEPLRGILSPPSRTLSPAISGFSGQSGASCGVLWSRVGWVGWGVGK